MTNEEKQVTALHLGGVNLEANKYLLNGSDELSEAVPEKSAGYAFFDGETLTLHNYEYEGCGIITGQLSAGLYVPCGELTVITEGENSISTDAVTKGYGIFVAKGAKVTVAGKGKLSVCAQNGKTGNIGIGGDGAMTIKSGVLSVWAGPAEYTLEKGKKRYAGDSYAVHIAEFTDTGARVTGNDKRGSNVNKNSSSAVTYDFHKKIPFIPIILVSVTLVAVGVTVWALFFRAPKVIAPDYALVEKEQYAEGIPNEKDEGKLDVPEGGGIGVTYSIDVSIDRASGLASLYFANPSRSAQDMVLQLIIKGELVAQSGTLNPGEQVTQLALKDGAANRLAEGGYDGTMRVLAYKPDTGEKAILNTDITVNITVE